MPRGRTPGQAGIDGWGKKVLARGVTVDPVPFEALPGAASTGVAAAVAVYGRFLGAPVRVTSPA